MKIAPITSNYNQAKNVSHKGFVGESTKTLMENLSKINMERANKYGTKYPAHRDIFEGYAKYADCLLENMKKSMFMFGKTCELECIQNPKNPFNILFAITSKDSDYVHKLDTVTFEGHFSPADMEIIESNILKKLIDNPDEINLKFKRMRHSNFNGYKADNFAPEKRIYFIENQFVHSTDNTKPMTDEEFDKFLKQLKAEHEEIQAASKISSNGN